MNVLVLIITPKEILLKMPPTPNFKKEIQSLTLLRLRVLKENPWKKSNINPAQKHHFQTLLNKLCSTSIIVFNKHF